MMPPLMTVGSSPPASSSAATMRGRRGLAVRAADGDRRFRPHQLGQHLRAADDRQAARPRLDQLRIVALDRRGDDDDRRVAEILRVVADRDLDAAVAKPLHIVAVGDVGAAHAIVLVGQHLGDAAHADPADPDEMDRTDVARQFHQKVSRAALWAAIQLADGLKRTPAPPQRPRRDRRAARRRRPGPRRGRHRRRPPARPGLRGDRPGGARARSASAPAPARARRRRPRRARGRSPPDRDRAHADRERGSPGGRSPRARRRSRRRRGR